MLVECLENSIENELKIPRAIQQCLSSIPGLKMPVNQNLDFNIKKNMRSAEEILKDYGLKG